MEIPCSQESPKTPIQKLVDMVDSTYFGQNSSPSPLTWPQIQTLVSMFKDFQTITITKQDEQQIFIDILLKYVELIMNFISSLEVAEYRKQRFYSLNCLTFIPDIIKDVSFCNIFVQLATVKIIDLLMYGTFNLTSKRSLLTLYNSIASGSKKEVRVEVSKSLTFFIYNLLDGLATYGDYVIQSEIMEALFRVFGTQILNEKKGFELLPGCEELGNALTNISVQNFDAEIRGWLNKFNENSQSIFTIACKKVLFGSLQVFPPENLDIIWIDFNLNENEQMLGFFLQDSWNRITVLAKDVRKIEIKRPFRGSEITVSIQMNKSCISDQTDCQDYFNKLDRHLQLVMENKDKDKITKLISTVLPHVFGDAFSHVSSKIAIQPRNLYKPLGIKISKRKSSLSDVSTKTSISRSKSDATSIEKIKISKGNVQEPLLPINIDSEKTVKGSRFSECQKAISVRNASSVAITDFSDNHLSCLMSDTTLDHVSIVTSDNMNIIFPSTASPIKFDSSGNKGNLYKPLGIKISKRKSSLSDVSTKTSISRSKSDATSIEKIKISKGNVQEPLLPINIDAITDFSDNHLSCLMSDTTLDHVSIVTSDNMNIIFPSTASPIKFDSSGNKAELKVQDNIVTSSYGEDVASSKIEILSGRCSGRSADHSKVIRDTTGFHYSEVFSSSPVKISHQNDRRDISSLFSEDSGEFDDRNLKKKTAEKISAASTEATMLDEEFETARENNFDEYYKVARVYSFVEDDLKKIKSADARKVGENKDPIPIAAARREIEDNGEERIEELHGSDITIQNNSDRQMDESMVDDRDEAPLLGDTEANKPEEAENSEDLFNRPTQITQREDEHMEQFTELSLAVNVGISDNQFSEDVKYPEKENAIVEQENKVRIEDSRVITSCSKEMEKENMVDLTLVDDDSGEEEGELKKKTNSKIENEKKENLGKKRVGAKNISLLNTPELLDILDDGPPLNKTLREIEQNRTDVVTVNKKALVAVKKNFKRKGSVTVKNNYSVKESTVIKEKPKTTKKRPRTLIKTGTKRFELDDQIEINQDDANANQNLLKQDQEQKNATSDALVSEGICVAFQKANDADGIFKKNDNIQETDGVKLTSKIVIEKGLLNVPPNRPLLSNMKHLEIVVTKLNIENQDESLNSSPEVHVESLPPKILGDDVASIDIFDKLKNLEEEKRLSNVNQKDVESAVIDALNCPKRQPLEENKKKLVVHLTQMNICDENKEETTSNSESELAPEINMENIDYLNTFDQLKMLEENRPSHLIQKNNESGISKCTETIKAVKDGNSHSKEIVTTGMDNKIVDNDVGAVDKMTEEEDEEDNRKLSSFILKKTARHLAETQEETVTDNFEKEIVDKKITEFTISRQNKKIDCKKEKKKRQTKRKNRKVANIDSRQVCKKSELEVLNNAENQIDDISNEKESITDLYAAVFVRNKSKATDKGLENYDPLAEPKEDAINEIIYDDQDNTNQKKNEVPKEVSFSIDDYDLELSPSPTKQKVTNKIPDSSPEVPVPRTLLITTVAQIHWSDDVNNTCLQPDREGSVTPVKKSRRLAEKRLRNSESSQECTKIDQEVNQQNRKKSVHQKRTSQELDDIVVADTPIIKRTRSHEKLSPQLTDDFDQLLSKEISLPATLNYSKMNTTAGNRSRKLFNQGNYSYLDNMPDIAEEKSQDLDETPIPLVKGTKIPKQKKNQKKEIKKATKTNAVMDQPKIKRKSPKNETPKKKSPKDKSPKESAKRRTIQLPKRERRKDFHFNGQKFVSLNELFNLTCRDLEKTHEGSSYLHQPMDIVARSTPKRFAFDSDESSVTLENIKNASPELPKNIEALATPPTPAYSSSDFVIEPFYKQAEPPQKKINILHDIVVNPKRPSQDLTNENSKRRKIEKENIPIPGDDHIEKDVAETHQHPEVISNDAAIFTEFIRAFKYIIALFENRHQPDFHNKLRKLIQITKDSV